MSSTKLLAQSALLSTILVTPVIQASPDYSTGDLVGGKLELLNAVKFSGGGGRIQSVIITDKAKVSVNKDVIFFTADPENTTFTENGALTVDDDDLSKIIDVAQITTWATVANNGMGSALDLAMPFVLPSDKTSLFCAIVERGTTDYVSTADLTLKVGIMAA